MGRSHDGLGSRDKEIAVTGFVLRIFFSGLIAMLPNAEGTEVTVLLISTQHEHLMAEGTAVPPHSPLLLARSGNCTGTCITDKTSIAKYLYSGKPLQQAEAALDGALQDGASWRLSNSDLSIVGPVAPLVIRKNVRAHDEEGALQSVPETAAQREDFSWVASLPQIAPGIQGFKDLTMSPDAPPGCLVAARLKLRSGKLFTYSLIRIDGQVRPIHFLKPSGDGPEAPYAQALASWVAAEIQVPGEFVEIAETNFDDPSKTRSMRLYPQNGLVEMAILNLPPFQAPDPNVAPPPPAPGQHFQTYYSLVKTPPSPANRLIPYTTTPTASEPQVNWASVHPRGADWSNLLEQLGLNARGKAPYDLSLCPIVRNNNF
jgi:hypothetical protein